MEDEYEQNYKILKDKLDTNQLIDIDFPNFGLKKLEANLFVNQTESISINFNSNEIEHIDGKIFEILTRLEKVYFSSNKIRELNPQTFKRLICLTSIDFSCNQIVKLDEKIFQEISTLKSIDFSSNKIKQLDAKIFEGLINLSSINFGSNEITLLDSGIFQGLKKLTWIGFSHNQIKLLNSEIFQEQNDLSYVDFSSNQITQLDENLFREKKQLKQINFNSNKITTLDSKIFQGLSNLIFVDFSSNKITQLEREIFKDVSNLWFIDFSSNQITQLDSKIFKGLLKLIIIKFNSNKITQLDREIFKNVPNLSIIDFSSNQIEQLDSKMIQGLEKLMIIDFSSNKITQLDREIFKNVPSLSIMDFSSNQIAQLDSKILQGLAKLEIVDFSLNQIVKINSNIFQGLTNLKTVIFSSNKLSSLSAELFNRLDNLENILFNSNYFSNIPSNIFYNLKKLKQINFNFDYSLLNSFSNLDYISIFDLFFTVYEGYEYDFIKNQISQLKPSFRVNSCFDEYLIMYCLSKSSFTLDDQRTLDYYDLKQFFSWNVNFCNYFSDSYTPLDFLLELESISNKTMTNILKHGKYTLDNYKFTIEDTDFKVRNIDTINYLCKRNSKQLMDELADFFFIQDFSQCFNIAIEEDCEMVACFLFNIFVKKLICFNKSQEFTLRSRKFFLSNFLEKCYEKKWWSFFHEILEYKLKIDQNNVNENLNFYMLFENSIQQKLHYLSNKKSKLTNENIIEMANSFNQDYTVLEWNTIKNASSNHILHFIASSKQTDLIEHHTTVEYLQLKWKNLPRFTYYTHLLLFLVFLISYSIMSEKIKNPNSRAYTTTRYLSIGIVFLFLFEEIIQIFISIVGHVGKKKNISSRLNGTLKNYLSSEQNVLELFVYPACFISLFMFEKLELIKIKTIVCSFIIIFLYGIFILRLEKLKFFDFNIGIYVTVFKRILYRSSKVLPLILFASFAFLFSFRINSLPQTYPKQDQNITTNKFKKSFWLNFIHIMTLNLGDFDNDNIGLVEDNNFNWSLYISYLIYLFIIPILIVNIFIGISVDELKKLIDQSHKYNTIIKIDYTLKMQDSLFRIKREFMPFRKIHGCLGKFISFGVLINKSKLTCLCSCVKKAKRNEEDDSQAIECVEEQPFLQKDARKMNKKNLHNLDQESIMPKSETEYNSQQIKKLGEKIAEFNNDMEQIEKRLNNSIKINANNLQDKIDKLDQKLTKLNTDMEQRLNKILSSMEIMSTLLSSNSIEKESTQSIQMLFIDE